MAKKLRVHGHQFIESKRGDSSRQLVNKMLIEIDDDVRYRIEGVSTGRAAELQTRSSHIRKFLLDVDEAARATADPPIVPYTKADQVGPKKAKKLDPNELVPCPACDGVGWEDCFLCSGSGTVTAKAAKAHEF